MPTENGKYRPPTVWEYLEAREKGAEALDALFEGTDRSVKLAGFEPGKPKPRQGGLGL